MSKSPKITLKNTMVYDYMRSKIRSEATASVKAIYRKHSAEIASRFGINNYQSFNFHVRKCLDWETSTGNKIVYVRMDNKEAVENVA